MQCYMFHSFIIILNKYKLICFELKSWFSGIKVDFISMLLVSYVCLTLTFFISSQTTSERIKLIYSVYCT